MWCFLRRRFPLRSLPETVAVFRVSANQPFRISTLPRVPCESHMRSVYTSITARQARGGEIGVQSNYRVRAVPNTLRPTDRQGRRLNHASKRHERTTNRHRRESRSSGTDINPETPRWSLAGTSTRRFLGKSPRSRHHRLCDDDPDCINEVAFGCISEIESFLDSIRERQALDEPDDAGRSEGRSCYR